MAGFIITLKNIITLREQTTEGFTDIMETELNLFDAFNINNLTVEDKKKLDESFDYLKNVKFPSILEQLENRFKGRIELDKTILQVIGFDKKEINNWLPKIYDALIKELK